MNLRLLTSQQIQNLLQIYRLASQNVGLRRSRCGRWHQNKTRKEPVEDFSHKSSESNRQLKPEQFLQKKYKTNQINYVRKYRQRLGNNIKRQPNERKHDIQRFEWKHYDAKYEDTD